MIQIDSTYVSIEHIVSVEQGDGEVRIELVTGRVLTMEGDEAAGLAGFLTEQRRAPREMVIKEMPPPLAPAVAPAAAQPTDRPSESTGDAPTDPPASSTG